MNTANRPLEIIKHKKKTDKNTDYKHLQSQQKYKCSFFKKYKCSKNTNAPNIFLNFESN